jgi:ribosomal protein S18 acetylase RimI-like enzyme
MSSNITYRSFGIERYDDLIDLFVRSGLSYKPSGRDSRVEIEKQMKSEYASFIGAFDGDRMVGFVLATFDSRKGWINRLCVLPEYRDGRGIALNLIKRAESFLGDLGTGIVAVFIEEHNRPSINLFRRMGYELHRDMIYLTKRDEGW